MRLWHKKLIKALPKQQLVAQWRELSAIVGSLNIKGTPNHLLVNKVLNYNRSHLGAYSLLIKDEMKRRNYKISSSVVDKIFGYTGTENVEFNKLYSDWHNDRYFMQCYYNLEEKYDCGGIKEEEFAKVLMTL